LIRIPGAGQRDFRASRSIGVVEDGAGYAALGHHAQIRNASGPGQAALHPGL